MHNPVMTGTELKYLREKLGETQATFGARFGVDQSTIHRWESLGVPDRGAAAAAVFRISAEISAVPAAKKQAKAS